MYHLIKLTLPHVLTQSKNFTYQGQLLRLSQSALTIPNMSQIPQIKPYQLDIPFKPSNTLNDILPDTSTPSYVTVFLGLLIACLTSHLKKVKVPLSSLSSTCLSPHSTYLNPFHSHHPNTPLLGNNHPILTRAKSGKYKPKSFLVHSEPITTKQALSHSEWFEVVHVKYNSLLKNDTWVLTTIPPHIKSIGQVGFQS